MRKGVSTNPDLKALRLSNNHEQYSMFNTFDVLIDVNNLSVESACPGHHTHEQVLD